MALSSVGNGLSQPAGLAAALSVNPQIAGTASGLLGASQMGIAALGTLLVGQLPRQSALWMVVVVVGCLALALVCGLCAVRAPPELPGPARRRSDRRGAAFGEGC